MFRRIIATAIALAAIALPAVVAMTYYSQDTWTPLISTSPQLNTAIASFEQAIKMEPHRADGYRYLSSAYQMSGDLDKAVDVWQRAMTANPGQSWPLVELGKMYEQEGFLLKAQEAFGDASSVNPQDDAANRMLVRATNAVAAQQAINSYRANQAAGDTANIPEGELVLINQSLENGWTFIGYIVDSHQLVAGKEVDVWSFWRAPTVNSRPSLATDDWLPIVPGIWARSTSTQNSFNDGGFEQPISGNVSVDFPNDIYSASPAVRQLRRIEHAESLTTVGALINDPQNRYTSYASRWKSLQPDMAYIVAADVLSPNGNPSLGWRWSGPIPSPYQGVEHYAVPAATADGWQQLAGLATPLPGASSIQVWLINPATEGIAYFDNVVMAPIPLPTPLYPGVLTRNDERLAAWDAALEQLLRYPTIVSDSQWQADIVSNGPLVSVGQTLGSGWTLQGYSTDEISLARSEPTPVVLYWQGPIGAIAGPEEEGWIDLHDGNWLQVISDATNLLLNGTFEDNLAGWETDLFAAPEWTRQVTVTQRSGYTTTVGVLTNTLEFSSTSYLSPILPVAPRTVYLQSGWLNGPDGRGYIGRVWEGNFSGAEELQDSYVAAAEQPGSWRRYAGVAEPPPGATGVQLWLLNYLSEGASAFDDIVFVPIAAPAPVDMGTGLALAPIDPVRARDLLIQYQDDPTMLQDEAWLANVAAIGPALAINQDAGSGWTLAGFTADEDALAAGAVTTSFYFWRGPAGVAPGQAGEGWYSLDAGYWLQIDDSATSLLPNGNFEQSAHEADAEVGFPRDYATGEPAFDRLQTVERAGMPTTAAVLANAAGDTTGIASSEQTIDTGRLYLQTGWLRSDEGGNGVLGVSWTGEQLSTEAPATELIASDTGNTEWMQYAGLLMPPPGADGVQVLVYNYLAPGSVEVDDVLLLPVLPPLELAPAVGATPSLAGATLGL